MYLVGSFVLVSLVGCGRGFFTAEREPWRAEAEIACLKSGAVKESAELVRISPISGPGVCGAEYPLKVAALGESSGSLGYVDDPRPPANIGNAPRWPITQPSPPSPLSPSPYRDTTMRQPAYGAAPNAPISLTAPGVPPPEEDDIDLPPEAGPGSSPPAMRAPNQRFAAGCTESASQRSSAETIGQAKVAAGRIATGPKALTELPCTGPSRGSAGGERSG